MNESPELVLDGGEPICQQIETQVRHFISSGHLRPGEELPTVRALAVGLAINPRTVARAYGRLEQMGLLATTELGGPRVAQPLNVSQDPDLKQLCERFLRNATRDGHSLAAVRHALEHCLQERMSS
jgi:GntR family transcriptional regulator